MPRVFAHRGASQRAPENTLEAFRLAAELGADGVELDVRRSADGFLVVHHDPHLGDGRLIAATRRAELPGSVPTLGAALDACEVFAGGDWRVNVEIKNDPGDPDFDPADAIADQVIAELVARDRDDRWLISAFRWEVIERCRSLAPAIGTAWLSIEVPAGTPERLAAAGHRALHPYYRLLDEEVVARCHASGVEVNVWTCDSPSAIRRLAGWGVDGFCTNVPDVAREALA